jgi:hypothetical protein
MTNLKNCNYSAVTIQRNFCIRPVSFFATILFFRFLNLFEQQEGLSKYLPINNLIFYWRNKELFYC